MKKRLISLALIAVLTAILLPALADSETFPQPEGGRKFESDWAVADGLAEIYYEEEGYRVTLTVENRDGAGSVWEYACFYMEDTDSLLSFSSRRLNFTIDPDTGETVYGDVAYEGIDEEGKETTFGMDADGRLIWKDGHDDAGAGLKFVNIGRFEGLWRNDAEEVEAQFMWNGTDEDSFFYTVYIWRGNEEGEQYALYLMNGFYDPTAGKLTADGACTLFTKNASGEYDSQDDGESVEAVFSVLENGNLLYETGSGIELEYDILGPQS